MNPPAPPTSSRPSRTGRIGLVLALTVMINLFSTASPAKAERVLPEYQVKALFLTKFAKYVDWPAEAFPSTNTPILIGVIGNDQFADELERISQNKEVNGRGFAIKHVAVGGDCSGCQMVFISHSEAARSGEILDRIGAGPILTVGEDREFEEEGGIVTFVIKDEKVRLVINLAGARKCGLKLSSKLLAVADEVKGRAD